MRTLSLIVALTLLSCESIFACSVECPVGFLGVCVSVSGECHCSCAEDAGQAAEKLNGLLREAGVSKKGAKRGVELFREKLSKATDDFSFELTDEGRTFTVEVEVNDRLIIEQ